MNRRDVLKSMLALPALSLLDGCRPRGDSHRQDPSGTRLCVVLHGPFGVVMHKSKDYRVTAFVPKLSSNDPATHEFRFLNLMKGPSNRCGAGYRFELLHHGLETGDREPQVDRGFDNVRFSVNEWRPEWDNYFVSLELPTPDAITYIPPLYPAIFESGYDFGNRLGSAPLNQVLEYRVRDANDIRLRSKHLQHCEAMPDQSPEPSRQLLEEFDIYRREMPEIPEQVPPSLSERNYFARWCSRYSYIYFLGVGLPRSTPLEVFEHHGIKFFNETLLPAIYQGQPIPPGSKLKKIGKDVLQCEMKQSADPATGMVPAVWRPSMQRPRLLTVGGTENCNSPGAPGTAAHPP